MYKLEVLPIAKNDIDEILYYISYKLKNRTAAERLNQKLKETINVISIFPYGSTIYKSNKKIKNEYRSSKVKNYVIFYVIDESKKTIIIIRVLYSRMNFNSILE